MYEAEKQLIVSDNYPRLKILPRFIFNDGFKILKARKWADQICHPDVTPQSVLIK